MKTYLVTIGRRAWHYLDIEVEASSKKAAKAAALKEEMNHHDWNENSGDPVGFWEDPKVLRARKVKR